MVKAEDAERALEALAAEGMRPEKPPEGWLYKAWDGEVLVDLIFHPKGMEIDDDVIGRGQDLEVLAMPIKVMALEDVLCTKLLALHEHNVDYTSVLQMARSLREKVDWEQVRARTDQLPLRARVLHDDRGHRGRSATASPRRRRAHRGARRRTGALGRDRRPLGPRPLGLDLRRQRDDRVLVVRPSDELDGDRQPVRVSSAGTEAAGLPSTFQVPANG